MEFAVSRSNVIPDESPKSPRLKSSELLPLRSITVNILFGFRRYRSFPVSTGVITSSEATLALSLPWASTYTSLPAPPYRLSNPPPPTSVTLKYGFVTPDASIVSAPSSASAIKLVVPAWLNIVSVTVSRLTPMSSPFVPTRSVVAYEPRPRSSSVTSSWTLHNASGAAERSTRNVGALPNCGSSPMIPTTSAIQRYSNVSSSPGSNTLDTRLISSGSLPLAGSIDTVGATLSTF